MLVLAYLGILSLIPLLTRKDDRDIQWHARNGLAFFIGFVAIWILWTIVGIFIHHIPFLGCALMFIPCAIGIGEIVITVMAIMKALRGDRFRLPILSDFADKM
jgi:uncharacterized membrane protein